MLSKLKLLILALGEAEAGESLGLGQPGLHVCMCEVITYACENRKGVLEAEVTVTC